MLPAGGPPRAPPPAAIPFCPQSVSFFLFLPQLVPTNLPADYQLEESDCPVMLCKVGGWLAGCLVVLRP